MIRVVGVGLTLVLVSACTVFRASESTTGGTVGVELDPDTGAPTAGKRNFVSPAGRTVAEGTVDERGWVLPLDVVRARLPRPAAHLLPSPRPGSSDIDPNLGRGPSPEIRLGPDDSHSENETAIDADGATVIAGWNSFTDGGLAMGAARSTDGGENWGYELLGGFEVMSDPAIAAGGAGRWYYSYIARGGVAGADLDIFVQRSIDDGESWLPPVAVTADANFDDKSYLAAQGDEVLVAYADFGVSPAKVHAARSIDGGASFDQDTVLANASVGGNGACPVIAPDGTFYVFWRDSFQEFLWLSRSDDAGVTWTPDEPIVAMHPLPASVPAAQGGYRLLNLPAAAVAPNGDLVVVWNDQLFGDADILAIRSGDGGVSWSLPVRVNNDPPGSLQFFPWVAIDGEGYVHVVWYDRRNHGVDLDLYYAFSTDGGASFRPNQRITAASFVPVLPTEGGAAAFIGDYNGLAAGPAGVFPFYQDSRRGEQDVWVARLFAPIFLDGLESGGTGEWSASVP